MMTPLLLCFLFGILLGQRFKVLVLLPAIALAVMAAVGYDHASTLGQVLGTALVVTTSLQIGYLVGAFVRFGAGTARIGRTYTDTNAASASPRRIAN